MSAQPTERATSPEDGLAVAAQLRRSTPASARVRGGHLRVLPIPDNEPPPLPRGVHRDAPDPRFVQGCLAVDFQLDGHDELFGPQSTRRANLPDPEAWAQRLITAILEAMDGVRPASQLSRWISPDIRERITRRGILARQRHQRPGGAHQVRAMRVCEPADGIAEVAAVISHQARVRALALRMTGVDGRWLITALEIG